MEENLARLMEALEDRIGDREAIVFRDRRLTYRDLGRRTRQLANVLIDAGLGCHTERDQLQNQESGQDHLALYLHNGNEYLEGMIGGYKARVAPFNVNYRYVAEELEYLLNDAKAAAIIYHSAFAETLAAVRPNVPSLKVLLQVADESGAELLEGAKWYEEALAAAPDTLDQSVIDSWSPDDLYILYTGGTTGMPKGVLWRQADIFIAALGGRPFGAPDAWESLDALVEAAAAGGGTSTIPAPPFMHGAAHWSAFHCFCGGGRVIVPDIVERFDAPSTLDLMEREAANVLLIVGDAFARPLVDALEASTRDLGGWFALSSGGAILTAQMKDRLLSAHPQLMIIDGLGASETGAQAGQVSAAGGESQSGRFTPHPGMVVLSAELDRIMEPGHEEMGWLGQSLRVPLGYLGDAVKSAATFPDIHGVRYAVPGDRARLLADGTLELYGRDSVTINSGGEKIFAEEVEKAIAAHPAIADVVVCGRPSERWGNEVVAVVQLRDGTDPSDDDLRAAAESHIARYKLPKAIVRRSFIQRSPSGKADYRWAKEQAIAAASADADSSPS